MRYRFESTTWTSRTQYNDDTASGIPCRRNLCRNTTGIAAILCNKDTNPVSLYGCCIFRCGKRPICCQDLIRAQSSFPAQLYGLRVMGHSCNDRNRICPRVVDIRSKMPAPDSEQNGRTEGAGNAGGMVMVGCTADIASVRY